MWKLKLDELSGIAQADALLAFKTSAVLYAIGSEGADVEIIEQILEKIAPDYYNGPPDDDFGKGVRKAVLRFQQARLLEEDGVVGPETRRHLVDAYLSHWHPGDTFPLQINDHTIYTFGPNHITLGELPGTVLGRVEGGKISNFGGPLDPGDRIYGQAYLTGAQSPSAFLGRHKDLESLGLVMSEERMLSVTRFTCAAGHTWDGFPEDLVCRCGRWAVSKKQVLESLDKWPTVKDWRGKRKKAGPSWCLEPDGCYCAIRRRPGQRHRRDAKCPRIIIWNPKNVKGAVALNTDYGPATSTGRLIDVSPAIEEHLGVKTDEYVRVAWGLDTDKPRLIG